MRLFSPATSLPHRAARAGFWALALHIADRTFLLVRTVILARLLTPDDFGLFGIALLTLTAMSTFTRTGFEPALIQREGDLRPYIDTAWTANVIRGFALAILLFVLAPLVGDFFDEPQCVPFLRFLGLSLICQGLTNTAVICFQKNLEFNKEFAFRLSGSVADLLISVTTALLFRNAWALLLGFTAGDIVRLIVSHVAVSYHPRFRLEKQKLSNLLGFGSWIWLTGIMFLVWGNGNSVVVGKVVGVAALGLFQMARRIPQLALQGLAAAIAKVAFPAYVEMQSDLDRLRNGYVRIAGFSMALCFPIGFGIITVGSDFVRIFLGEKWLAMVPALMIVTGGGLIALITSTGRSVFMGRGSPEVAFQMQSAAAATVMVLAFPLTSLWGLTGAALTVVLSSLAMSVVWYVKIKGLLGLSPGEWGRIFAPPTISSAVMVGAVSLFKCLTSDLISDIQVWGFVWFAAMVLVGASIYFLVMRLFQSIVPNYEGLSGALRAFRV